MVAPASKAALFGVFFVRDGAWVEWAAHRDLAATRQEVEYLVGILGVQARVFREAA